jgi:hypothetical protein
LPCEGGRPATPAERVPGPDLRQQRRASGLPGQADHFGEWEAWRNQVRGMRSGSPRCGLPLLLARMQGNKISPASVWSDFMYSWAGC